MVEVKAKKISADKVGDSILTKPRTQGARTNQYTPLMDRALKGEILELTGLPYHQKNRFLRFVRGKNADEKYKDKVTVLFEIDKDNAFPDFQNKNSYRVVLMTPAQFEKLKTAKEAQ